MLRRLFLLSLLIVASLSLSGCFKLAQYDKQVVEKNQELSDKVRNEYGTDIEAAKDKALDASQQAVKKVADKALRLIIDELTDISKQKIDDWIEANGLNQYGDVLDTMYAGGSPLFDEATGESKDKYEYILTNHPELVEELNL